MSKGYGTGSTRIGWEITKSLIIWYVVIILIAAWSKQ